ncbi:MAG: hypothetical protein U0235_29495 [Polyangiaceae bacterium]
MADDELDAGRRLREAVDRVRTRSRDANVLDADATHPDPRRGNVEEVAGGAEQGRQNLALREATQE